MFPPEDWNLHCTAFWINVLLLCTRTCEPEAVERDMALLGRFATARGRLPALRERVVADFGRAGTAAGAGLGGLRVDERGSVSKS